MSTIGKAGVSLALSAVISLSLGTSFTFAQSVTGNHANITQATISHLHHKHRHTRRNGDDRFNSSDNGGNGGDNGGFNGDDNGGDGGFNGGDNGGFNGGDNGGDSGFNGGDNGDGGFNGDNAGNDSKHA